MIEKIKKLKPIRFIVFCFCVYSLALFFEAGRIIAEEKTLTHFAMSLLSIFALSFGVLIMGFWIYAEEKEKGNLRGQFGLYEWLYKFEILRRTGK